MAVPGKREVGGTAGLGTRRVVLEQRGERVHEPLSKHAQVEGMRSCCQSFDTSQRGQTSKLVAEAVQEHSHDLGYQPTRNRSLPLKRSPVPAAHCLAHLAELDIREAVARERKQGRSGHNGRILDVLARACQPRAHFVRAVTRRCKRAAVVPGPCPAVSEQP